MFVQFGELTAPISCRWFQYGKLNKRFCNRLGHLYVVYVPTGAKSEKSAPMYINLLFVAGFTML